MLYIQNTAIMVFSYISGNVYSERLHNGTLLYLMIRIFSALANIGDGTLAAQGTFKPNLERQKESLLKKILYFIVFRDKELSGCNIKKIHSNFLKASFFKSLFLFYYMTLKQFYLCVVFCFTDNFPKEFSYTCIAPPELL